MRVRCRSDELDRRWTDEAGDVRVRLQRCAAEGSEGTSGGDALAGSERCEASEGGEVRGGGGQRQRVALASGGACRRRARAGGGWGVGQAIGPSGQRAMRSALQTRSEGPETKCRVAGCHTTEGSLLVSVGVNVNA